MGAEVRMVDLRERPGALPKRPVDSIYDVGVDDAAICALAQSGAVNNVAVSTVSKLAK